MRLRKENVLICSLLCLFSSLSLQWLSVSKAGNGNIKLWVFFFLTSIPLFLFLRQRTLGYVFDKSLALLFILLLTHQIILFIIISIPALSSDYSTLVKLCLYSMLMIFLPIVTTRLKVRFSHFMYLIGVTSISIFYVAIIMSANYAGVSIYSEFVGLVSGKSINYFTFFVLKSIFNLSSESLNFETAATLKNTIASCLLVSFSALLISNKITSDYTIEKVIFIVSFVLFLLAFSLLMSRSVFIIVFMMTITFSCDLLRRLTSNPIGFSILFSIFFSSAIFIILFGQDYFEGVVTNRTNSIDERLQQYSHAFMFIEDNLLLGGYENSIVIHNFLLASWARGGFLTFLLSIVVILFFVKEIISNLRMKFEAHKNIIPYYKLLLFFVLLRLMTGGGGGFLTIDIWFAMSFIFIVKLGVLKKNNDS